MSVEDFSLFLFYSASANSKWFWISNLAYGYSDFD